jgi:hypothetical protein
MVHKSTATLAGVLALSACGLGPPRLDPLTAEDQASFTGFTCRAIREDGGVIYVTNGDTGLIRYRRRPVRMTRLRRDTPFNPVETLENLTMISSAPDLELSLKPIVEPPGSDSDDSSRFLTRRAMVTIEDRSFGGARRENQGADLVCSE